jgi:hypothetical protein
MTLPEIKLFADEPDNNSSPRSTPPPMQPVEVSSRQSIDMEEVAKMIAEGAEKQRAESKREQQDRDDQWQKRLKKSEEKAAAEKAANDQKWQARIEAEQAKGCCVIL